MSGLLNEPVGVLSVVGLAVGGLLILLASAAVLLTLLGSILALLFFKTRQIIIPGTTLFILNVLEVPIRYLLWFVGVEEDIVSRMIVEVRNTLYRDRYEKTPYDQRAIFIPQCLRSPSCPAPLTPEGIRCLSCGRCGIGKVKDEAEALGYRIFISPGSSLVKRMVKKYRPRAVLGVGCPMEVKEGTEKMASYGLPVQGVILERDGCVDTRVDAVRLMEKIWVGSARKGLSAEEDAARLKRAADIGAMWNGKDMGVEVVSDAKRQRRAG